MVTKDELFFTQGTGTVSADTHQKGTRKWAENNGGSQDESSADTPQNAGNSSANTPAAQQTQQGERSLSYAELFKELNPQLTEEQKKEIAKKEKQKRTIAAITDGVNALSNLYFTHKGAPSIFDGRNTLSERNQIRYDKMIKDRKANEEAYRQGLMKAYQMDREWDYRSGRDQKTDTHNDRMYNLGVDKFEHEKSQDEQTQTNWKNTFDENKRQFDENLKLNREKYKAQLEADKINKEYKTFIMNGGKKAGDNNKRSAFVADRGKEISIHNDVWKNAVPQLFDIMIKEGLNPFPDANSTMMAMKIANMKADDKEDFVRGHWHESQGAADLMMYMSTIDPYNMESRFEEKFNVDEDDTAHYLKTDDNNDNTAPYLRNQ